MSQFNLSRIFRFEDPHSWLVRTNNGEHVVAIMGAVDGMLPVPGISVQIDGQTAPARFNPVGAHAPTAQGEWRFSVDAHAARITRQMIDLQIPYYLLEVEGA